MENLLHKKISTLMEDIERYTHYGSVFYDFESHDRPLVSKSLCRLCSACLDHHNCQKECFQNAKNYSYQSWIRGEAFTFKCWLGLYGIIIPINASNQKIYGAVEIGGLFPKGTLQQNIHQIILTLNKFDPKGKLSPLVSSLQGIEELDTLDIASFSEFLKEATCYSGLLNSSAFALNAEIWNQQNRLAQRADDLKTISLDKEKMLFSLALDIARSYTQSQNTIKIQKRIDELLSLATNEANNNVELLKHFIITALSIIKMHLAKYSQTGQTIQELLLEIENINSENDVKSICLKTEKILRSKLSIQWKKPHTELSKQIINYIEKNFQKDLKVNTIAREIGTSPSTIMHKLKKETGLSFLEHLNSIRIKEAKRLLAYTDLTIGEIAERCGFSDQSYFSKVFTANLSIPPREFRKMLIKGSQPQP